MNCLSNKEKEVTMKYKVILSVLLVAFLVVVYFLTYAVFSEMFDNKGRFERYSNDDAHKILMEYRNKNMKFLEDIKKDDVLASVNSNGVASKGVFINSNIVLATEHAIKGDPISVNGYSARVIFKDKEKDFSILETLFSSDNYAEIDIEGAPNIDKEYVRGDSGTPIYTKDNKLHGILIGKNNNTNKYVILKIKDIYKKINIYSSSYINR